jgi:hypothetical protein
MRTAHVLHPRALSHLRRHARTDAPSSQPLLYHPRSCGADASYVCTEGSAMYGCASDKYHWEAIVSTACRWVAPLLLGRVQPAPLC